MTLSARRQITVINSPGVTLPSHVQKSVIGRLLGFEVLSPRLSELQMRGHKDIGARLSQILCWLTNEALDDPDSDESLESFLGRLVGRLQAEAASFRINAAQDDVALLLDEFEARVRAFREFPNDPLVGTVMAVTQTASHFYSTYGASVPSAVWERSVPLVSFLGDLAGLSFAPEVHLQLRTMFDTEDPSCATVFIKLVPRWLDAETIATFPRALLHEYISHVPQGPYSSARRHPDADDAFAEGWMDYIAHQIHRSLLECRPPVEAVSDHLVPTWTSIYDAAAEHFFWARCKLKDSDPAAAARSEGAAAARQLHDLFRRLPETKCSADEYLYRLSFGLNASALDSLSRRRVAAEVRRNLLRASRLDILVAPLREWAEGKLSVEELAARLMA
jgi:hypothetical protein